MVHLLVKVHEQNNFVLNRREEVMFVNKLVDIFVSQLQVDLQSFVIALVICVSRDRHTTFSSRCAFHRVAAMVSAMVHSLGFQRLHRRGCLSQSLRFRYCWSDDASDLRPTTSFHA